jgi:hypothetical protein
LSQRSTVSPTRSEEPGVLTPPEPAPPQKSTSTQITRLPESQPASKRAASFEEYVTTFAAAPGAVAKVKRRRKLDAKTRESFKQTRKIGACLECRFRKRSVSLCKQEGDSFADSLQESPFVGYSVGDCEFSGRSMVTLRILTLFRFFPLLKSQDNRLQHQRQCI